MLKIFNNKTEAIRGLADYFVETVTAAIRDKSACTVALSGGNSPKELYHLLASEEYRKKLDWNKVYFFLGDERYVPASHPDNNGNMIKTILFDRLHIAEENVFYVNTALSPDDAAKDYAKRIRAHFADNPLRFDLVLLGLGEDAHTASLFPHTPVLRDQRALVSAVYVEEQKGYRITMTAALINEAYAIAFLVYGEAKAKAVQQVLEGKRNIDTYPAQLINPEEGEVYWFMDVESAQWLEDPA